MQVNPPSGSIDIRWKHFVRIDHALRVKLALDAYHQFYCYSRNRKPSSLQAQLKCRLQKKSAKPRHKFGRQI